MMDKSIPISIAHLNNQKTSPPTKPPVPEIIRREIGEEIWEIDWKKEYARNGLKYTYFIF